MKKHKKISFYVTASTLSDLYLGRIIPAPASELERAQCETLSVDLSNF